MCCCGTPDPAACCGGGDRGWPRPPPLRPPLRPRPIWKPESHITQNQTERRSAVSEHSQHEHHMQQQPAQWTRTTAGPIISLPLPLWGHC